LLAALAGGVAAATPIYDRDWGWHLATYRRMRDELAFPREDLFSYASQGPYEPVHWIFQLVLGALVDVFGTPGLAVYRLGMSALFAAALFVVLRRAGARTWGAALALGWVLVASWQRLLVRPHLVSFVGIVLLIGLLLAWRRWVRGQAERRPGAKSPQPVGAEPERRPRLWLVLPLFWVWANAHPGVLFGVLLALGFVVAETAQAWWRGEGLGEHARLAAWVGAGCLLTGLNPLGFGLYPYLLAHREMQGAIDVLELRGLFERPERGVVWHLLLCWTYCAGVALYALRVRGPASWALLAACLLGVCAAVFAVPATRLFVFPLAALLGFALVVSAQRGRRGRVDLTLLGAVAAFGILGVVVAREAPLALALLAILVAPQLPTRGGESARAASCAALTVVLLALAGRTYDGTWGAGLYPGAYPRQAADWILRYRPAGPLYNTNGVGGYLVHRLWPRLQVYSDGRMPLFLEALPLAFSEVEARYAPQVVVLDWGQGWGVSHGFELERGFHERYVLVFVGAGGKVYVRRDGPNALLAKGLGYRQLRYGHRFYPGLSRSVGGRRVWLAAPPREDVKAFQREIERAHREAPDCPYLPPLGFDPYALAEAASTAPDGGSDVEPEQGGDPR